ncbi:MAG: hypothetical protein M3Y21_07975 [Candidatus Eremiobacteraeota bacterium]|nr:hypothetical protein [Candidatus Eremiobacteraeota bacterium]
MFRRDPTDKNRQQRMTGSYLLSLSIHAIAIALLFSVTTSSSEQASSDAIAGGEVVTVSRQALPHPRAPAVRRAAPPIPHAPRVAPPQNKPQAAAQRLTRSLHELAKLVPKAPPNGYPIPIAPQPPVPQATQAPLASPNPALPALPISVPKAVAVAVAIKVPSTTAPSPLPSAAPSAKPSAAPPRPSSPPVKEQPTTAPVLAKATAKVATPAAVVRATSAPQPKAGVPSPGPTTGPAPSHQAGTLPNPGPKAVGKPGPKSESPVNKPARPAKPISVPATPTPSPRPPPIHRATEKSTRAGADLNARLKALIPNNPVHVTQKVYAPGYAAVPTNAYPTPPPEIVARTRFIMDLHKRNESAVMMWVTGVSKRGPLTICSGWLYRVPLKAPGYLPSRSDATFNPNAPRYPGPQGEAGFKAIVEPDASYICSPRDLKAFTPP